MKKILLFAAFLSLVFTVEAMSQSFSFKKHGPDMVVTPYYPDSTQFIQITGTVKNISNSAKNFRILRLVNNLPAGWHTQMCYDLCYSTETDTIPLFGEQYTLNAQQSDSTSFYIDFLGEQEGSAMAIVRIYNIANFNDYAQDTFRVLIGDGVGVQQISTTVEDYKLSQNFPNPFNPSTTISFSIPKNEYVSLKVYNSLGKEVASLLNNEKLGAGSYNYDFDVNTLGLSSGVYYYTFTSGDFVQTKKMLLVK